MAGRSQPDGGGTSRRTLIAESAAIGAGGVAGCLGDDQGTATTPVEEPATQPARTEATPANNHGGGGGLAPSDLHAAVDGHVVPVAPGLGPSAAIDPGQTETPVQDAVDLLQQGENRQGGTILLPPEPVTEAEPITGIKRTTIQGFGMYVSAIGFPTETHGFVADGNETTFAELRDLNVTGPGGAKNTGSGLFFTGGGIRQFNLDNVLFDGWNDKVIQSKAKPYECNWGKVHMWGNNGTLIHIRDWGPANSWALGKLNASGGNVMNIRGSGGHWDIGAINCGGDYAGVGQPFHIRFTGLGGMNIGYLNFEPGGSDPKPSGSVVGLGGGHVQIQHITNHVDVEHVVTSDKKGAHWRIGTIQQRGPEVRSKIALRGDQGSGSKVYQGPSTDVENRTGGELDTPVACLGDLTLVQ